MTNQRTTLTKDNAAEFMERFKPEKVGDIKQSLGTFQVLIGQGGAGKTTLAAEIYKLGGPGETIVLNSDAGVDAITHLGDKVETINIDHYAQFKEFTAAAKTGNLPYKNYLIDNIVSLSSQNLEDIGGIRDQIEIQEYGKNSRDILFDTKEWRTMARDLGFNVIMTAWDEIAEDSDGRKKRTIAFQPALQREFPGVVTIIGHVEVLNDPTWRKLTYAPGPKTIAKFRRSLDSAAQKIPFDIYYQVNNLPMADIIRTMKGEQDWPDKKYPKPSGT